MASDEKESAIAEEEAIEIENEKESETGLFTLESILHRYPDRIFNILLLYI